MTGRGNKVHAALSHNKCEMKGLEMVGVTKQKAEAMPRLFAISFSNADYFTLIRFISEPTRTM
jgi:hypothetical protein